MKRSEPPSKEYGKKRNERERVRMMFRERCKKRVKKKVGIYE